uniref:Uncharacterized protein n=1 Tax=Oryza barthii TaxID=65489 RepID=A0A0D3GPQ1_9ORYZ
MGPAVAVRERLSFMNEYLAEDRDPVVAAAVAFVTLIVLGVGSVDDTPVELPKKLYIGPPMCTSVVYARIIVSSESSRGLMDELMNTNARVLH